MRYYYAIHTRLLAVMFGIEAVARWLQRCDKRHVGRTLARFGAAIAPGVKFKSGLVIDNASGDEDATGDFSNLRIGEDCSIGHAVLFDLPDRITIGPGCAISAGVSFVTHSDCGKRPMAAWYPRKRAPITLGRGCWIGVNAVILPGVTLDECCVVAAGAVVKDSFPARSVIAGVPARLVKSLDAAVSKAGGSPAPAPGTQGSR
jgi:acetyltransferase-like isoleucine patch superfamily enzyme